MSPKFVNDTKSLVGLLRILYERSGDIFEVSSNGVCYYLNKCHAIKIVRQIINTSGITFMQPVSYLQDTLSRCPAFTRQIDGGRGMEGLCVRPISHLLQ